MGGVWREVKRRWAPRGSFEVPSCFINTGGYMEWSGQTPHRREPFDRSGVRGDGEEREKQRGGRGRERERE